MTGRLCFDVEGNGLLPTLSKMHCIVTIDVETEEVLSYHDDPRFLPKHGSLKDGLKKLSEAAELIGHNIIDYDVNAIKKLFPGWTTKALLTDTLVECRLYRPDLMDVDAALYAKGKLEPQMRKSHSLKAWGQRLGGHRKKEFSGDWDTFTQEMLDYCIQDVWVNVDIFKFIERKKLSKQSRDIERRVAEIVWGQEQNGFGFRKDDALTLQAELMNRQAIVVERLKKVFLPWFQGGKVRKTISTRQVKMVTFPFVTMPRISEKTGKPLKDYHGPPLSTYTEGTEFTPIKLTEFSPASRDHIANRLAAVYGWKPSKFTPDGRAQMDETVLESLPRKIPAHVRQDLLEFFALNKFLGMLGQGAQSWLRNVNPTTTHIHGRCIANGAITGRATHRNPNIAQVPKVTKTPNGTILLGYDGGWGFEARSLFVPTRPGWEMTGADCSGLELRLLAHYLKPYDGGDYIARLTTPGFDPHEYSRELCGVPTRAQAKNCMYAFIYGAGLWKLGHMIDPTASDRKKMQLGKAYKEELLRNFPGLNDLYVRVQAALKARGFLVGLDGRRIYGRALHAALNSLLQSAGAVVCKQWLIELHAMLAADGLVLGIDWAQMAWVHDEVQTEHKPGLGEIVGPKAVAAAERSGEVLGLHCPTTGEYKTGSSWALTH